MPAGYSGTPLAKKLGIAAGNVVAMTAEPEGFRELLEPLPDDVVFTTFTAAPGAAADVVLLFVTWQAELAAAIEPAGFTVFPHGSIWVAWPKRASKVPTDMSEDRVRDFALPLGLVDNKVAAIDDTWSGLRVVWRREHRGGEAPPVIG